MSPEDLPVVGALWDAGPEDHVFDVLILMGPVVIGLFVVLGRHPVAVSLSVGYVLAFVCYVAYKSVWQ